MYQLTMISIIIIIKISIADPREKNNCITHFPSCHEQSHEPVHRREHETRLKKTNNG